METVNNLANNFSFVDTEFENGFESEPDVTDKTKATFIVPSEEAQSPQSIMDGKNSFSSKKQIINAIMENNGKINELFNQKKNVFFFPLEKGGKKSIVHIHYRTYKAKPDEKPQIYIRQHDEHNYRAERFAVVIPQ